MMFIAFLTFLCLAENIAVINIVFKTKQKNSEPIHKIVTLAE